MNESRPLSTSLRRLLARARGQSMVEFALVLPVFLFMTVGVIDLGRTFYFHNQLVNGVREGARVGVTDQNATTIRTAVKSRAPIGLTDGDITVTCFSAFTSTTKSCGSVVPGDSVQVSATLSVQPITLMVVQAVGTPLTLSSSAKRSVE